MSAEPTPKARSAARGAALGAVVGPVLPLALALWATRANPWFMDAPLSFVAVALLPLAAVGALGGAAIGRGDMRAAVLVGIADLAVVLACAGAPKPQPVSAHLLLVVLDGVPPATLEADGMDRLDDLADRGVRAELELPAASDRAELWDLLLSGRPAESGLPRTAAEAARSLGLEATGACPSMRQPAAQTGSGGLRWSTWVAGKLHREGADELSVLAWRDRTLADLHHGDRELVLLCPPPALGRVRTGIADAVLGEAATHIGPDTALLVIALASGDDGPQGALLAIGPGIEHRDNVAPVAAVDVGPTALALAGRPLFDDLPGHVALGAGDTHLGSYERRVPRVRRALPGSDGPQPPTSR